ncbi:hypothetical protein BT63DRAFT_455140 [Microthyrium microscopicum]|uniref:Zn(2)-C6 fungal-type domain-containing protein n=1 Tax=Microthyrium microscopicum TaxID=703497 RepID=A0A6A6UC16_9PEZI|nr:hypothetical protein BT63DRAFT_455140 [Microthyrium microscopicum]
MESASFAYSVFDPTSTLNTAIINTAGASTVSLQQANTSAVRENGNGPIRRQNRSCDQCRKGKRRCDAVVLRDQQVKEEDANSLEAQYDSSDTGLQSQQTPGPCTYCTKTKKNCTFEWLKSHEPISKPQKDNNPQEPFRPTKKQKVETPDSFREGSASSYSQSSDDSVKATPGSNGQYQPQFFFDIPSTSEVYSVPPPEQDLALMNDQYGHSLLPNAVPPFLPQSLLYPQPPYAGSQSSMTSDLATDISYLYTKKRLLTYDTDTNEEEPDQLDFQSFQCNVDLSHFSQSELLAATANKQLIDKSLMKIYHDSMENALSCWLNERTCPYRMKAITNGPGDSTNQALQQAWSKDWPNRIFHRVNALDRTAGKLRNRPLTVREGEAASKALYLVILAFGTQWAQGSRRSREEHPSMVGRSAAAHVADEAGSSHPEYDRRMQEKMWYDARQALVDCADMESFKVAFACIVFSLIQKPMSAEQQAEIRRGSTPPFTNPSDPFNFDSLEEQIDAIIEEDGPPIYLEQGVRNMHSLRHKLQRRERESKTMNDCGIPTTPLLSSEDRATVDLMAWLGYMLESLTSAMHQRPLVVADDDCDVLPESIQALNLSADETAPKTPSGSRLWNDYFFLQERSNRRGVQPRYPCTYDQAAAALTDAAPIKVLLYRKVTLLQSLFSRGSECRKIEDAITDARRIYDHWKNMYEPFVQDCITNHDHLHPRIQTWYICVTAHWHLATLLLADVIAAIDAAGLGDPQHAHMRTSTAFVRCLRRHNAHMVSDLARCATPREDGALKNFHPTLNAGALLTEPWTAILIRVFAKAAVLLLQEACTIGDGPVDGSEVSRMWQAEQLARRSEDCVRALKYLGKKSDTARMAGDTLADALYSKTSSWSREQAQGLESAEQELWPGLADGAASFENMPVFNEHEGNIDLQAFGYPLR